MITQSYKWREGDENIVKNIKERWPNLSSGFEDIQLAELYSEFSLSSDYGDNDKKFPEWLTSEIASKNIIPYSIILNGGSL